MASVLYGERIRWYAQRVRAGHLTGLPADVDPQTYAASEYLPALEQKARFARNQKADAPLRRADREALAKAKHSLLVCFAQPALRSVHGLAQISRRHVSQLVTELSRAKARDGDVFAPGTVRRHVMALSGLLSHAMHQDIIDRNPMHRHPDIPAGQRSTAVDPSQFLTQDECARLLTQILPSPRSPWAVELAYTLLYTGARISEVIGLLVRDVDFDRGIIHVLEHAHRSLKTRAATRRVPLWAPLATVLRESLERAPRAPDALLFPRHHSDRVTDTLEDQLGERMLKSLRSAARRAGIAKDIDHHITRHSYISERITMVQYAATGHLVEVSRAVVAREVSHDAESTIQQIYGHVQANPVRQETLDYGEPPFDFPARQERAAQVQSAAIRAGIAASTAPRSRRPAAAPPTAASSRRGQRG